nr:cholinesterase 2-like [Lytechinus pictus]
MSRMALVWFAAASSCIFLLSIGSICASNSDSNLVVETTSGKVRGARKNILRKEVITYLGIPYGEAPTGSRRFKKSTNKTRWDGIFDASRYGYACYQVVDTTYPGFPGAEMWNPNVNMSEDCLNLNIWVPADRQNESLPVMVWIFGGGFFAGSASLDVYNGEVLSTTENVIVVTINYRVANLGFLALGGSDNIPGNAGLFDQALAISWIHDNIASFGGDVSRLTLFGESAGAVSTNLHMFSPMTKDLFTRVILQSSSSFAPWGVITAEEALSRGLLLAERTGCYTPNGMQPTREDLTDIINCLQRVPPEILIENEFVVSGTYIFPFVPVVDGEFLTETPTAAKITGSFKEADVLLGTNTNEGSFFMVYDLPGYYDKDTESLINRTQFFELIPRLLPEMNEFGRDAIAFQYTDWLDPDNPALLRDATELYVGDYNIICPVHDFGRFHASSGNKVYAYHFDQRAANNMWGDWMGVMHGDEIAFAFGQPLRPGLGFSEGDRRLSEKMMTLWANFAKTGDPNGAEESDDIPAEDDKWLLFDQDNQNVYLLKDTTVDHAKTYTWDRANYCAFWSEYVPFLNTQTANIDESERQWKEDFYQWSTKYMVDWKAEFNHYLYSKESGCPNDAYSVNESP